MGKNFIGTLIDNYIARGYFKIFTTPKQFYYNRIPCTYQWLHAGTIGLKTKEFFINLYIFQGHPGLNSLQSKSLVSSVNELSKK